MYREVTKRSGWHAEHQRRSSDMLARNCVSLNSFAFRMNAGYQQATEAQSPTLTKWLRDARCGALTCVFNCYL